MFSDQVYTITSQAVVFLYNTPVLTDPYCDYVQTVDIVKVNTDGTQVANPDSFATPHGFLILTLAGTVVDGVTLTQNEIKISSYNFAHAGNYIVTVKATMQDTWGTLVEESYSFNLEMVHWCTLATISTQLTFSPDYYIQDTNHVFLD